MLDDNDACGRHDDVPPDVLDTHHDTLRNGRRGLLAFDTVDHRVRGEFVGRLVPAQRQPGEVIVDGDTRDRITMLTSGVAVEYIPCDSRWVAARLLGPGDVVGFSEVGTGHPYPCRVTAATVVTFGVMDGEQWISTSRWTAIRIALGVAVRRYQADQQEQLLRRHAENTTLVQRDRVIALLEDALRLLHHTGHDLALGLPVSMADLAALVGIEYHRFGLVVRRLETSGIIRRGNNDHLSLVDLSVLGLDDAIVTADPAPEAP